ncbi:MAG: SDR family oxidoreductase [Verrucomicrobiaceae bacterium]|nr:MAG: SDR family oxidoreductase [Verrucomicrobiaceae bacterium]
MKRTPEESSLRGKRAVVTGAGSGIGRATAITLAAAGAKVALLGRTPEELKEVFDEAGGGKAGHLIIAADVSDEKEMVCAYQNIAAEWDSLDIVVANAGINGVWAPLEDLEVSEWDETLAVNLRGTFLTVKLAVPLLKKNGGSVIVVSSINGNRIFSNSGATAYSCSKAAQVAFSRMTALELAKDRIRVNSVCPGAITTNIEDSTERRATDSLHLPVEFPEGDVPLTNGSPGTAEEVARSIWYLASDLSSHVSGTEIYVDGAQSLLQG